MITIVDYGVGNLRSVENALRRLGAEYRLSADPAVIAASDKVLLPGVGNAAEAMFNLRERGLVQPIRELRKPLLGICIGMQVLCRRSEEENTECIGLFDTDVVKFNSCLLGGSGLTITSRNVATESRPFPACGWAPPSYVPRVATVSGSDGQPGDCRQEDKDSLKVPHMGWNRIGNLSSKLFKNIDEGSYVYFVHSYRPNVCRDTTATTEYGGLFSSALKYENFYGTQFHPEKSGDVGERILQNFLAL